MPESDSNTMEQYEITPGHGAAMGNSRTCGPFHLENAVYVKTSETKRNRLFRK